MFVTFFNMFRWSEMSFYNTTGEVSTFKLLYNRICLPAMFLLFTLFFFIVLLTLLKNTQAVTQALIIAVKALRRLRCFANL